MRGIALPVVEESGRRAMLHDDTAVGEVDVVGNFAGKAHFVGHQHAGHALGCQVLDGDENLLHRFGVEGRGDFIEQHDVRVHGQ